MDDDVTQAMSKGGVLVNPFGMLMMTWGACESLWNVDDDVTQAMSKRGVLVNGQE